MPQPCTAALRTALIRPLLVASLCLGGHAAAQAQFVELCGPAFPEWKIPFQVFDLFRDFPLGAATGPKGRACPGESEPAYVLKTLTGKYVVRAPKLFDNPRLQIGPGNSFVIDVRKDKISSFGSSAHVGDRQGNFIPGARLGVRAYDALGTLLTEQTFEPTSVGGGFSVSLTTPIARYEIYAVQPDAGRHYLVLSSVNFWNDTTYIP